MPQEQYHTAMRIVIKNHILNISISGSSESESAIIFLPGWGRTLGDFDELRQAMQQRVPAYRFVQIDLPGFGGSPLPLDKKGLEISDYVAMLENLLEKMEIERAVFVGHSFGGKVAVAFAAAHPERAEKLVLIASAGASRISARARLIKIGAFGFRLLMRGFRDGSPVARRLKYHLRRFFGSSDYVSAASPGLRETLKECLAYDIKPLAIKMRVPVLLLWGRDDTVTPLSDTEVWRAWIPSARLAVLDDCGHFPFLKYPERCVELIGLFLQNV